MEVRMNKFETVAVVVRTYNNNPDSAKAVKRALDNGVGHVIVVVNAHDEATLGNVANWCASLADQYLGRLSIIEMKAGYSWSNALNLGIERVRLHNMHARLARHAQIEHVLNVSVEALWESSDLQQMLEATHRGAHVVGTTFVGKQHGNIVLLGRSYRHPRNTMMLVSRRAIEEVGSFDATCDLLGGMEDFQYLLRCHVAGLMVEQLDLGVTLLVGKHHDQEVKETREREAMIAIRNQLVELFSTTEMEVQKRLTDALVAYEANEL
jgi:hypothetical protein